MADSRPCRILVVVTGPNPGVVGDVVTAFAGREGASLDEIHVVASAAAGERFRATLLRHPARSRLLDDVHDRLGTNRGEILFGSRTIHLLGPSTVAPSPGATADDALDALRRLCVDENEVTVVASPDAGPLGILVHAALQCVGRPTDRFFFLDYPDGREPRRAAPARGRRGAARSKALLSELPIILAARPPGPRETFQELALSRRLARQRLSDPGILFLDGHRRTIRVDDTELSLPRLQFFWLFTLATLAPETFPLKALARNVDSDVHGRLQIAGAPAERAALEAIVFQVRKIFTALFPSATEEFPLVFRRACGPSPGLPSIVAKINARLKRVLDIGAAPYLIAGGRGTEGYRLTLPASRIRIEPRLSIPHAFRPAEA